MFSALDPVHEGTLVASESGYTLSEDAKEKVVAISKVENHLPIGSVVRAAITVKEWLNEGPTGKLRGEAQIPNDFVITRSNMDMGFDYILYSEKEPKEFRALTTEHRRVLEGLPAGLVGYFDIRVGDLVECTDASNSRLKFAVVQGFETKNKNYPNSCVVGIWARTAEEAEHLFYKADPEKHRMVGKNYKPYFTCRNRFPDNKCFNVLKRGLKGSFTEKKGGTLMKLFESPNSVSCALDYIYPITKRLTFGQTKRYSALTEGAKIVLIASSRGYELEEQVADWFCAKFGRGDVWLDAYLTYLDGLGEKAPRKITKPLIGGIDEEKVEKILMEKPAKFAEGQKVKIIDVGNFNTSSALMYLKRFKKDSMKNEFTITEVMTTGSMNTNQRKAATNKYYRLDATDGNTMAKSLVWETELELV